MDDKSILQHINELLDEEHALLNEKENREKEDDEIDPERHQRLQTLQVTLDQCWDLLRQRRARREFAENPDGARVRDPKTVERYLQ